MIRSSHMVVLSAIAALAAPLAARAQTTISEDFTGTGTNNSWWYFNGACLTAGSAQAAGSEPSGGSGGKLPGCVAIGQGGQGPLYYQEPLVGGVNGVGSNTQTLPDPAGQGALRFTNGWPGGYAQNGAILSTAPFPTGQGVAITFKTVTYRGNSGGGDNDGADGISFYLMDAGALNTGGINGVSNGDGNGIGAWGGSLGYTCSNANPPYNGLVGAYLAVGIDEYGNFLNGANFMPSYTGNNPIWGDNTALGYGYRPNRIGLRGAGNVAWNWLNTNYPAYYPSSFTAAQQHAAVRATCRSGFIWNSASWSPALDVNNNPLAVYDYTPIPGAYVELPYTQKIANESAMNRGAATPIFYQLTVTQNGLLSLSYSYNGGAYQPVISAQSIAASNGPLPADFLFGFAGSTGGSTNIHEILCFKAEPATTSASSAGASEKQSAKLETGAQAYFAYYNPAGWTGAVTASGLGFDAFGNVIVAQTPNWDASCTLTGVATGSSCPTTGVSGPIAAQVPNNRTILSWNGNQGIAFRWNRLTAPQKAVLDAGDGVAYAGNPAYTQFSRERYLRGARTDEINSSGVGLFRARGNVLADIIDSSPTWVGPPFAPYIATWKDRLNTSAMNPENAPGAQTYAQYVAAEQTRLNVVYIGANDGLVHGFRSGSYDVNGNFVNNGLTPNDGQEVLAYMPGAVVQTIHSMTTSLDYANAQYAHAFFVDATPTTGDLFYNSQWHTWLVGGLGPGGAAIYALDVTNPAPTNFTEGNAAALVVGEWTPATISCTNLSNCGGNLGNTYGTPQIRRLHNGTWAVIFGNGYGSATGDAGIYIMTVDPNTAARTFYYLSTGRGSPANPNGIAYASAADLDGDHIADYIYAGDLLGNVWRFDLTSANPANWGVTPGPLFKTPAGQPITTAISIAGGSPTPGATPLVMVLFGTGQKTPLSTTSPATYSTGTQALYGVWDWNMGAWNAMNSAQYASLAPAAAPNLVAPNYTIGQANLHAQTITINATTQDREIANNATICWAGSTACTGGNTQYGWTFNLPGAQEQVVFNPELVAQALTVNSIVPAPINPTSCTNTADTGFTYVVSALTGGAFTQVFLPPSEAANPAVNNNPAYTDMIAIGLMTNATGSSFVTGNSAGTEFLVYETNTTNGGASIGNGTLGLNLPPNTTGRRLSWIERR
ncbi:MAG TPA: PilC/PilY family type IV pilus protein [Steroidobacteraceae bacterium]|nr:PilC/PilY family type IV pilus protein [Steroidobacteraceae bacterium]